jgi:PDZ domain-containing secreted protein
MEPFEQEPPAVERRRFPRWPFVLVGLCLLLGAAVVALWPLKVPYYAISPGPVEEVADLITIEEDDVLRYDMNGDLFLLTVGLREVNVFEWVEAQFDPRVDLVGREVIRPPADGVLQAGDIITHIEGRPVITQDHAAAEIRSFGIGDSINLTGTRGGEPLSVEITLAPHPDLPGSPMVGVVLDTVNLGLDPSIEVEIDSRNIGGPSAGMMYALTVIDLLTEEDLAKGHRIAGTGTISVNEAVGAIGGVRQKVFAARSVGAEYILVPTDNYPDALTAGGDDIEIIAVGTLQDALDFLDTLEPVSGAIAAP